MRRNFFIEDAGCRVTGIVEAFQMRQISSRRQLRANCGDDAKRGRGKDQHGVCMDGTPAESQPGSAARADSADLHLASRKAPSLPPQAVHVVNLGSSRLNLDLTVIESASRS